jgi:hypothetical protein
MSRKIGDKHKKGARIWEAERLEGYQEVCVADGDRWQPLVFWACCSLTLNTLSMHSSDGELLCPLSELWHENVMYLNILPGKQLKSEDKLSSRFTSKKLSQSSSSYCTCQNKAFSTPSLSLSWSLLRYLCVSFSSVFLQEYSRVNLHLWRLDLPSGTQILDKLIYIYI